MQITERVVNSKGKFMTAEEALEALFQYDHQDSNSDSSSKDTDESKSGFSINCDYDERSSSQHVYNSIISNLSLNVIDEVSAANTQEFSVAVDTQTNLHSTIQHDQQVHVI